METLSSEYLTLLRKIHSNTKWGNTSVNKNTYPNILNIIDKYNVTEMLDYGAGQGLLKLKLNEERPNVIVHEYEPGREEISASPEPAPFVVCVDVLEHVEPEYLDAFLDDLVRVVVGTGYFTVSLFPAIKILPDGRNAHLIIEPFDWWIKKISDKFDIRKAIHSSKTANQGQFIVQKKLTREEFYRQWEKP